MINWTEIDNKKKKRWMLNDFLVYTFKNCFFWLDTLGTLIYNVNQLGGGNAHFFDAVHGVKLWVMQKGEGVNTETI